jgi:tetratricopeptide (TPR) repeat protein
MSEPALAPTLLGLEIAITGRLASMTRQDAIALIGARGGRYVETPNAATQRLVVGLEGWALRRDGRPTQSLANAHELQAAGSAIRIVDEAEFLAEAGLSGRAHPLGGLYTIEQLARMLDLPKARLRAFVRKGLIRPQRVVRRLCWFDFAQVASAKALQRLLDRGAQLADIRRGLRQLEEWLPGAASRSLRQLEAMTRGGPLLLRLDDGKLVEPSGQLRFPFAADRSAAASTAGLDAHAHRVRSPQDWFARGVAAEDEGRWTEAEDAYYRSLLAGGLQPETAFNLGNVLHALGRPGEAVQRYMMAVEIDPEYVEAWNNLGNVLAELGRSEASLRAYRRALEIEPEYADAHFNLAETYQQLGRHRDARRHWLAYLDQSSGTQDRVYVDRMLAECERRLGSPEA